MRRPLIALTAAVVLTLPLAGGASGAARLSASAMSVDRMDANYCATKITVRGLAAGEEFLLYLTAFTADGMLIDQPYQGSPYYANARGVWSYPVPVYRPDYNSSVAGYFTVGVSPNATTAPADVTISNRCAPAA